MLCSLCQRDQGRRWGQSGAARGRKNGTGAEESWAKQVRSREPHGICNLPLNRSAEKFHKNEIPRFGGLASIGHPGFVVLFPFLSEIVHGPAFSDSHLGRRHVARALEGGSRTEEVGHLIFIHSSHFNPSFSGHGLLLCTES